MLVPINLIYKLSNVVATFFIGEKLDLNKIAK